MELKIRSDLWQIMRRRNLDVNLSLLSLALEMGLCMLGCVGFRHNIPVSQAAEPLEPNNHPAVVRVGRVSCILNHSSLPPLVGKLHAAAWEDCNKWHCCFELRATEVISKTSRLRADLPCDCVSEIAVVRASGCEVLMYIFWA